MRIELQRPAHHGERALGIVQLLVGDLGHARRDSSPGMVA